eukprot:14261275-Ditylum_brightwellii.AAC.1
MTQVKKMIDIISTWTERVQSGYICISDLLHHYTSTIKKSLEYPLLATSLEEKDLKRFGCPALEIAPKSSSLSSSFPRDVLYGQTQLFGLGLLCMYTTQGIK